MFERPCGVIFRFAVHYIRSSNTNHYLGSEMVLFWQRVCSSCQSPSRHPKLSQNQTLNTQGITLIHLKHGMTVIHLPYASLNVTSVDSLNWQAWIIRHASSIRRRISRWFRICPSTVLINGHGGWGQVHVVSHGTASWPHARLVICALCNRCLYYYVCTPSYVFPTPYAS